MINMPLFKENQNNLMRDDFLRNQKTIVIDIENTLVTKMDLKSLNDLNELKAMENFEEGYVIVKLPSSPLIQNCCELEGTDQCLC